VATKDIKIGNLGPDKGKYSRAPSEKKSASKGKNSTDYKIKWV